MRISWPMENPRSTAFVDTSTRPWPHFQTSAERERIFHRREKGKEFSTWKDAYHASIPSNPIEYIACVGPKETSDFAIDPVASLPVEIFDMIFSLLTVPALDAARFTCRAWWIKITSNQWVLDSVLRRSPQDVHSHCDLLKTLDRRASMLYPASAQWHELQLGTSQVANIWRIRFRVNHSCFRISPKPFSGANPSMESCKLVLTKRAERSSYAFFVIEAGYDVNNSRGLRRRKALFLYQFHQVNQPLYIGTIEIENAVGPCEVFVTEKQPNQAWMLHVSHGQRDMPSIHLFSITAKPSFSSNETPYLIKPLVISSVPPTSLNVDDLPAERQSPASSLQERRKWKLLRQFNSDQMTCHDLVPQNEKGNFAFDAPENEGSLRGRFHLTEDTDNGNIAVVYRRDKGRGPDQTQDSDQNAVVSTSDDNFQTIALLSPPGADFVYQNIATAQEFSGNAHGLRLRVAVLWHDRRHSPQATTSTLYIYEVFRDLLIGFLQSAKEPPNAELRHLQGRRVQSAPFTMGGIHPHSPVWSLYPDADALRAQAALSGLHFTHIHRCFIWGPATAKDPRLEVSCKVYDFKYGDLRRFDMQGNQVIQSYSTWYGCVCTLHDAQSDVTLPSMCLKGLDSQNGPLKTHKSIFPRRPRYVERPREDNGSIEEIVSPERQAAQARLRDWQLERIEGMRRAGLSSYDIAEIWMNARWTQYGSVKLPIGWKTVGKSLVKESEENRISSLEMQDSRVRGMNRNLGADEQKNSSGWDKHVPWAS